MKPIARYRGEFRWDGVPVLDYKDAGDPFRDVARQVLFGPDAGLGAELRYFEIGAGGYTTLERHEHGHAVVILRGEGRVLVGTEIHSVSPFDLVRIGPLTWHQFRASADAPLGFLCLVKAERDRPQRPSPEELRALCQDPEVARFIRAGGADAAS